MPKREEDRGKPSTEGDAADEGTQEPTPDGGSPGTPIESGRSERRPAAVEVAPRSVALRAGDGAPARARTLDEAGGEMPDRTYEWRSENAAVAVVNQSGMVFAVGIGLTAVTATDTAAAPLSGRCAVTVS